MVLVVDQDVDTDITIDDLKAFLPKYHVPKEIIRKTLEYTSTGKLKRSL